MNVQALQQENAALREKLERARDRIRELSGANIVEVIRERLPLAAQEAYLLGGLLERDRLHKDGAYQILYGSYSADKCGSLLSVLVTRIRKKLRYLGVEVKNIQGFGWYIPRDSKAKIREILS